MIKNLIVTGASTGLGLAIAISAAKSGFRVYATMRNLAKRDAIDAAAKAAGVSLTVLQMDVQDTASVESCVADVIARDGKVDVIVANAGTGFVRATEQASEAEIADIMDVNFMGVMRCVKAVMPHMRKARSGHVIAISSVGGLVGQPFNEIYCASKFAVEGYIEGLASYAGPAFGLHFSLIEPGGISSEFAARVLARVEATGGLLNDDYLPILQKYLGSRQNREEGIYQTPEQVAQVVIDCLQMTRPPVRMRSSAWAEGFAKLKTAADPDGLKQQAAVVQTMLGGL